MGLNYKKLTCQTPQRKHGAKSALGINRSRSAYYYCICTLQRHIPARVTTITTSGDYLGEELLWLCGVVESYKAEYTFESRAGAKISGNTVAQRATMQGLFRLTTVTSWIRDPLELLHLGRFRNQQPILCLSEESST